MIMRDWCDRHLLLLVYIAFVTTLILIVEAF